MTTPAIGFALPLSWATCERLIKRRMVKNEAAEAKISWLLLLNKSQVPAPSVPIMHLSGISHACLLTVFTG